MKSTRVLLLSLVGILAAGTANAQVISWTDWTSATVGAPGSAAGLMTAVQGSGNVSVTYSGQLFGAQTAGGANYWNPSAPYTSATVANAPNPVDILQVGVGSQILTQIITFSTPVTNPVMSMVSLGSAGTGTRWTFNAPFTILSQGAGFWGNGTLVQQIGNVLVGNEGHGTIGFTGTFSSISWTAANPEDWGGFTIGAPAATAPEPGTIALVALGIAGGVIARRRQA